MMRTVGRTYLLLGMVALLLAFSCKDPVDPPIPADPPNYENGAFIVNEGNFQAGNASLSFLHFDADTVSYNILRNATDLPLGDVAQSLSIYDGKLWTVVNNSGKVQVHDLPDAAFHCLITGLTSPRYLLFLGPSKAYCTDLYADAIAVIDPSQCQVTGSIPVGGWTEKMIQANGVVYVTQTGTDKVLVIDPATDAVTDSLSVGRGPNSIVQDGSGKLWVMCDGGLGEASPALYSIDPANGNAVTQTFTNFDVNASPSELCAGPDGERLYWLYQGGVRMLDLGMIPSMHVELIPSRGGTFYGLAVDPVSGNIYVSDALDYVRQGWLYRFTPQGALIDSFATGVIPGEMVFY